MNDITTIVFLTMQVCILFLQYFLVLKLIVCIIMCVWIESDRVDGV